MTATLSATFLVLGFVAVRREDRKECQPGPAVRLAGGGPPHEAFELGRRMVAARWHAVLAA